MGNCLITNKNGTPTITDNGSTISGTNSGTITVKANGLYLIVITGVLAATTANSLGNVPTITVNGTSNSPFVTSHISDSESSGSSTAYAYTRTSVFYLELKTTDTITYTATRHYGCSKIIRLVEG